MMPPLELYILLVDDEGDWIDLLRPHFASFNLAIETTRNGRDAR